MKKAEKSAFLKRNPFLKSPHPAQRAAFSTATNIPDLLDDFKGLSTSQKKTIVDQARLLIEGYYVHRPLKEAMHAVQPVQALAVLRQRLTDFDNDLDFHAEMTRIFNSVKDLHTNYTLPKPFGTMRAMLPFLVERFCDGKRTGWPVHGQRWPAGRDGVGHRAGGRISLAGHAVCPRCGRNRYQEEKIRQEAGEGR